MHRQDLILADNKLKGFLTHTVYNSKHLSFRLQCSSKWKLDEGGKLTFNLDPNSIHNIWIKDKKSICLFLWDVQAKCQSTGV